MRILIADDDPIALSALNHTLVQAGYEVETANSGLEALERIKQRPCHLLVSDLMMPGLSGVELCRAVREEQSAGYTYFILLTAQNTPEEKVDGLAAGADDFITKPFNPSELLARIRAGERILLSSMAKQNEALRVEVLERRRVEQALRESEERYCFLANAISQLVWTTTADGRCDFCNRRWHEYTGLNRGRSLSQEWAKMVHPEDLDRGNELWRQSLQTGQPFEMERRLKRAADGAYRWHLARAFPMRDSDGRIIRWVGTCTDIHDIKAVHAALDLHREQLEVANGDLSNKNKKLSELYKTAQRFVDDVSHEFRTPLTVIKEFSSIMRDGLSGPITHEQEEYLDIVTNRVDDLTTMVDDMLDISKLEAGMLGVCRRECTAKEIIQHVWGTVQRKAAAHKVSLILDIEDGLPTVYCDAEKIGRVIVNLTVNAIKFSTEGAEVTVWARHDADESQIAIGVSDHGAGISPQDVQAIFDRFKQLDVAIRGSTKGFGLGLSIAKELVHLNLGEMRVESTVGKGSTFSFTVLAADPPHVLRKWLDRVTITRGNSARVSMLASHVHSEASPELLDEVDDFLQRQLRYSDLLFRVQPDKWVSVVSADDSKIPFVIARVGRALSEENRNRPREPLPVIDIETVGSWSIAEEASEIIQRLELVTVACELCGTQE